MNSSQLLARNARKYPQAEAVIGTGKRYTYAELDLLVNRFAHGLQNKGITQGDKVVLFMPNVPEFVITYFAVQRLGAIIVPINSDLTLPEVEYVVEHSGAKALVAHEQVSKVVGQDVLLIKIGEAVGHWIDFEAMLAADYSEIVCHLPTSSESTILYTSGTTGKPKGVLLSYENILTSAHMMCIELEMKPESRMLAMMALTHSAPLHLSFLAGIVVGATIVLTQTFTPEILIGLVEEEQITHFFGPPVAYLMTAKDPALMESEFTSVKWWVYGGAPVSRAEVEYIQKSFRTNHLVNIYGLTESGPNGTLLRGIDHFMKAGSIGNRATLHAEIRVVNEQGEDVGVNEVGEIYLRGEGTMLGYYKDEQATRDVFHEDWLKTGDLAIVDEDGFIWLADRKTDLIITGGKNIYPKEIENVLLGHPSMKEVAVIGVSHPEWGEVVKAFFVAHEQLSKEELKELAERSLALYKVPKLYKQVEELPRNAAGEVLKQALREHMANGLRLD